MYYCNAIDHGCTCFTCNRSSENAIVVSVYAIVRTIATQSLGRWPPVAIVVNDCIALVQAIPDWRGAQTRAGKLTTAAHSSIRIPDVRSGNTRFEVAWSAPRPALLIVADQGSCSWNNKFQLFDTSKGGLRGWIENDPHHRTHNNHLLAIDRSGLNWANLEVQVTLSVAAAPWGKCAFFGALSGAAQEFFENFGIDSELFELMYPKLSHHCHRGHIPFSVSYTHLTLPTIYSV